MELWELSAYELSARIRSGELRAKDLVASVLRRIREVEPLVHAYISLDEEGALRKAEEVDARVARGEEVGVLAGVPVAVKDNICIKGMRTTCASKILENFVSPYDATVVEKLKAADAVFLGKTNLDEFAMGSSTENSYFGPTRNPHDPERVPGGSSGGSAAALAAGEAVLALGSDTGGSIRQPASFCGVVGLKPTYGRVSRYGLVAFASSLDQIGPMAKNVKDTALLLNVISGYDPRDSTSAPVEVPDFTKALDEGIEGIRIGLPREYFAEGLEDEVREKVLEAVDILKGEGAEVVEVSLPHTKYAIATYYIVAPAEASSNLARYDGVKYGFRAEGRDLYEMYCNTRSQGFGEEVKRRIMLGTYTLSAGYYEAYYLKALKVRTLIKQDFEEAFETCDLLATPTSPTVAFRLGEKVADPLTMYLSDVYTVSVNLAGLPGISVPCGSSDGLPVGLQLIGRPFDEETLLRVAHVVERSLKGRSEP
ncbi:MAG: Asp-tRNA(Asn)/Glu-tRNA(Gln) amidotransferase GatCAB subunit A [Candidatus Latescibacterota bacterium]|nr:MAG: Asp-tRNA(Asn)/Glu-tRNA(Gln) amidotransferase GatCAB subunit A [Candidatus Latescibacterota bacterium]